MKIIKRALIGLVILVVSLIVLIEWFYYEETHRLEIAKPEIEVSFSEDCHKALWALIEETNEIYIEPISASEFSVIALQVVMHDDYKAGSAIFPSGIKIAGLVGRRIMLESKNSSHVGHLPRIVASIWVTKNFTANEALDYLLDGMYLGNKQYGVQDAATYYFGKSPVELSRSEITTLIAISRSPYRLDPYCNPTNLDKLSRMLYQKVDALWGDRLSAGGYTYPNFIPNEESRCKIGR